LWVDATAVAFLALVAAVATVLGCSSQRLPRRQQPLCACSRFTSLSHQLRHDSDGSKILYLLVQSIHLQNIVAIFCSSLKTTNSNGTYVFLWCTHYNKCSIVQKNLLDTLKNLIINKKVVSEESVEREISYYKFTFGVSLFFENNTVCCVL
jgi:hypothetical protein